MFISSASVSRKEQGKFELNQEFSLDATEDFKKHASALLTEYTSATGDEKEKLEEEIMSQFGDYDYITIDKDAIYKKLEESLDSYPTVDFHIDEVMVYISSPIGYPGSTTTMEQIWEALTKITVTVEANLSYELKKFEDIETELAKVSISLLPNGTKELKD